MNKKVFKKLIDVAGQLDVMGLYSEASMVDKIIRIASDDLEFIEVGSEPGEGGREPLANIIVMDQDNPPSSGDDLLDNIVKKILLSLRVSDLPYRYKGMHKNVGCDPLTGFCRITTESMWEILATLNDQTFGSYKPCRVLHSGEGEEDGPHFFLKDFDTGHIIDLTAGQFRDANGLPVPVPYDEGVCDTEGSRSASKGWANKRQKQDSIAQPGYDLGAGARRTIDRMIQKDDAEGIEGLIDMFRERRESIEGVGGK